MKLLHDFSNVCEWFQGYRAHYVIWALRRRKLPATRKLVQNFVQANNKEIIESPYHWPCVKVESMDNHHKGPLIWRMCQFHDVILVCKVWMRYNIFHERGIRICCPACRTTLVATRFRVAVICPIIQVPHCIRVFFYFVWFVFINHIFQFYYELCTYCNILDIYLS